MPFVTKDRVLETSTTTGTGTYTLAGAATGFQTFLGGVVSANDYVPYFVEDGTNWECGIGRVLSSPSRLERTTVLKSSNSNNAVNWGAGTRNLRCGWPAELNTPRVKSKSVAGSSDVTLTQDEQRADVLILTGALTANISVIVDATPWRWIVFNNTSGAYTLTVKVSGQTGVAVMQGKSKVLYCDGTDVEDGLTDGLALMLGTPQASTSGTFIDFTVPAGAKRVTINFSGVSTNGSSNLLVQVGDSGGVEPTGYVSTAASLAAGATTMANATNGFVVTGNNGSGAVIGGTVTLDLENSSSFAWVASGILKTGTSTIHVSSGDAKALSAELDRVRITTAGGTDTFDAGEINISFER